MLRSLFVSLSLGGLEPGARRLRRPLPVVWFDRYRARRGLWRLPDLPGAHPDAHRWTAPGTAAGATGHRLVFAWRAAGSPEP